MLERMLALVNAAFYEMHYTTKNKNGLIDISKAVSVNEFFLVLHVSVKNFALMKYLIG